MAPPAFVCWICEKPVSRVFGLNASVEVSPGIVDEKISIAGYCAAHRDSIVPAYEAELSKLGTVIAINTDPQQLRPDEAVQWAQFSAAFMALNSIE